MVKCPRCEFPVDETTRTTCPLCFTPISPAGEAQVPVPPESAAAPEQPVVAQPPVVPVMAPPTVPEMTLPVVPMPPPQQVPPPQGYAPPPPQTQQMPGMYQAQQQGGEMPQAAPQPPPQQPQYTPGSAPRPGVRVSLTGEVIDDSMNTAPPPSYVGGTLPPPRPAGPAGGASARRPVREEAPDASKGNPVAVIILSLMLVIGLGFGGWWFMSHRSNPKTQAEKATAAIQKGDWKTIYELSDISEEDKKKYADGAAFAKDVKQQLDSNPMASQLMGMLKDVKFTIGEPKIDGDTATVPITSKMNFMGREQSSTQNMEFVNRGGVWKIKGSGGAGGGLGGGMMGGMGGSGMMGR